MKNLFENWRKYLNEDIDMPDIGMPAISKLDIIDNPNDNIHQKNALLNMFDTLKDTDNTDPELGFTINNILESIYVYSGKSDDFKYTSKEAALQDYIDPYRYADRSLKSYHDDIKKRSHDLTRHTEPAYWGDPLPGAKFVRGAPVNVEDPTPAGPTERAPRRDIDPLAPTIDQFAIEPTIDQRIRKT